MIKIQISGGNNDLVGSIITKALRDAGVTVSSWSDAKPREVAKCVRDAKAEGRQVVVVAMRDGK